MFVKCRENGGRRPNLEINFPFLRKIDENNFSTEVVGWLVSPGKTNSRMG